MGVIGCYCDICVVRLMVICYTPNLTFAELCVTHMNLHRVTKAIMLFRGVISCPDRGWGPTLYCYVSSLSCLFSSDWDVPLKSMLRTSLDLAEVITGCESECEEPHLSCERSRCGPVGFYLGLGLDDLESEPFQVQWWASPRDDRLRTDWNHGVASHGSTIRGHQDHRLIPLIQEQIKN